MLNLPVPPRTRITRQIECISCRELFAIAEADAARNQGGSDGWQLTPDFQPGTRLRYQPDRSRQPVMPANRVIPEPNEAELGNLGEKNREQINCPRCGADNRNWLNLLNPPGGPPSTWMMALLPSHLRLWVHRFPVAVVGILFATILVFLTFVILLSTNVPAYQVFGLLFFIMAASIAPVVELTPKWKALREDKQLRQICHPSSLSVEAKLWVKGVVLVILTSIVLPSIFFQVGPKAFIVVVDYINPPPEERIVNIAAPSLSALNDFMIGLPIEVADAVENTLAELDKVSTNDVEALAEILEKFSEELDMITVQTIDSISPDAAQKIQELETVVLEATTAVRQAQNDEQARVIKDAGNSIRFLALWGVVVGLSCLVSVFTSMGALKHFVAQIDSHLPSPIFSSIAKMTRVVVWEAGAAIEIGEEIQYLQWTNVWRNDDGGIVLAGIYRDAAPISQEDAMFQIRVPAQRYEITTDRWCRIQSAEVTAVRVPVQPRLPDDANIGREFFSITRSRPITIEAP